MFVGLKTYVAGLENCYEYIYELLVVPGLRSQDNVAGCLLQTATTQIDIAKELSEYEIKL